MPLLKQRRIYRPDLQANPDVLYLFGDNDDRVGLGGQAAEMRDEENAVGVRTKWKPGMGDEDFFSDDDFDHICDLINQDLEPAREHLAKGFIVVLPLDGLGTGLSQLPKRAPQVYEWLMEELTKLEDL